MIKNNRIYIHLGLHKTGTTFFQKSLYPSYKEFNYKSLRDPDVLAEFNQYILRENELTYCLDTAEDLFFKNLDLEKADKEILTLCEEQFSGLPLQDAINRKLLFDRLNALFPNANYILVVRNQKDWIKSMYAQYLKKGGTATLDSFLSRKDTSLNFSRGAYIQYYEYYRYIIQQTKLNRVQLLYYEDLIYDPKLFFQQLLTFFKLQIPIDVENLNDKRNVSSRTSVHEAIRFYNIIAKTSSNPDHLIPSRFKNLVLKTYPKLGKRRVSIDDEVIEIFIKRLQLDNSALPDYNRIRNYGY